MKSSKDDAVDSTLSDVRKASLLQRYRNMKARDFTLSFVTAGPIVAAGTPEELREAVDGLPTEVRQQ